MENLAIIIPVYNEERFLPGFIKKLLREVKNIKDCPNIIFINDGSIDKTSKILAKAKKSHDITVIELKKNRGKGEAMKIGSERAVADGAKYLIYMDGDGQHDPSHLPVFINNLKEFPIVFGYRKLKKTAPFVRRLGNQISSFIIKHIFRINRVGDILCGYFGIQAEIFSEIKWHSNDYGVEAEISAIVSKKRIPFKEVLVKTIYLDRNKGVNIFHAILILFRIPFWAVSRHTDKFIKLAVFLCLAVFYLLLAYKNPFSTRSLIPNLEPYPDSLYYSVPALNFINGLGFSMDAFGYHSKIVTPPIYSLFLMPFFALFRDVRSFYYANLIFMIGSLWLFISILNKIFYKKPADILLVCLGGFFFVSNFYLYILPTLLMAESITLFFTLLAIFLLISPTTKVKNLLAGTVGTLLILIKFSNLPVVAIFYTLYLIKSFKEKYLKYFVFSLAFSLLIFTAYILSSAILVGHKNLSNGVGFSVKYFVQNFLGYSKLLIGKGDRYLWFNYPMVSPALGYLSILGILFGLVSKQWRMHTYYFLAFIFGVIVFMSFFYYRDIRYLIMILPLSIFFATLCLWFLREIFGEPKWMILVGIFMISYLLVSGAGQIPFERPLITFKKQVGLNFRHTETPWNYLAVLEFNSYFSTPVANKPYLATFLPPYYIGLFTNENYNYLPISQTQEFSPDRAQMGLSDLVTSGAAVYISPYYQANNDSWRSEYDSVLNQFRVAQVHSGCLSACNIYKLLPK